ncbi:MAG: hypothetical protein LIO77_08540 [Rikenellaceae bacterium]|nr:hypothetical protein [Rikenellaceae bacterium]
MGNELESLSPALLKLAAHIRDNADGAGYFTGTIIVEAEGDRVVKCDVSCRLIFSRDAGGSKYCNDVIIRYADLREQGAEGQTAEITFEPDWLAGYIKD